MPKSSKLRCARVPQNGGFSFVFKGDFFDYKIIFQITSDIKVITNQLGFLFDQVLSANSEFIKSMTPTPSGFNADFIV